MSKVTAVFKREYFEVVRKKSFLIWTLLAPFLLAAMMVLPALLTVRGMGGKRVVVVDGTGQLAGAFEPSRRTPPPDSGLPPEAVAAADKAGKALKLDIEVVEAPGDPREVAAPILDALAAKEPWNGSTLDGVLVIPDGIFSDADAELLYYSRTASDMVTQERLGAAVNRAVSRHRLATRGIGADEASELLRRVSVEPVKLSRTGEERRGGETGFILGFVFAALLMIPMLIYGQEVMRGIVQEKTDRVIEILVSAMRPFELLSGKILGLAAVGLTQIGLWFLMGVVAFLYLGGAASVAGVDVFSAVDLGVLPFFLLFYVLGYLIFVSIYAIGGAVSNSEKEAQQTLGPLVMLTMIPWFLAMPILQSPESTLATVLSLLPVFSPITMFMRIVVSEPPAWQLVLSVVISAATVWALFWATAKIFRVAILSYGKRPTLKELWGWLRVA